MKNSETVSLTAYVKNVSKEMIKTDKPYLKATLEDQCRHCEKRPRNRA